MILFYKHISVDTNKIKCKKKLWNSEDFIFTPISYDSKPYILQTPPLFVPFGEQTYDNEEKHNISAKLAGGLVNNTYKPGMYNKPPIAN